MGEHVVGHLLDPAPGAVGAYQAGGSPASHLLHHVVSAPGGRGSDHLGQALAHDGPPVGEPCIKLLLENPPVDDLGQPPVDRATPPRGAERIDERCRRPPLPTRRPCRTR